VVHLDVEWSLCCLALDERGPELLGGLRLGLVPRGELRQMDLLLRRGLFERRLHAPRAAEPTIVGARLLVVHVIAPLSVRLGGLGAERRVVAPLRAGGFHVLLGALVTVREGRAKRKGRQLHHALWCGAVARTAVTAGKAAAAEVTGASFLLLVSFIGA